MSMMAHDLRRSLDPVLLARDVGIEPDAWQAELLRKRSRRCLMLCARQTGKTETAIELAHHTALYEPESLTLIVSPSLRQSAEVLRRLVLNHQKLKNVPELTAESALRAQFTNKSRIIALPGSSVTTRGYAGVRLVIIDEASRVEDTLLAALRPTMATVDGSLIALSTPAGRRGWFFESWTSGEGWHRVKVAASDCPRLSREFLDDELKQLGPTMYRQEYELEFIDDAEMVFSTDVIARAFTSEVKPLWH